MTLKLASEENKKKTKERKIKSGEKLQENRSIFD